MYSCDSVIAFSFIMMKEFSGLLKNVSSFEKIFHLFFTTPVIFASEGF